MAEHSAIEWTDATWNVTTGCTKVSPACARCYIERTPPFRMNGRRFVKGHIPLQLHENRMTWPLDRWKTPKKIFVDSLSDLFHEDVPFEFIKRVRDVMAEAQRHTFQLLTKRPERMLEFTRWLAGVDDISIAEWPRNVWLGCSAENQHFADKRIPLLLQTPAAVRFISAEPLLEAVDLSGPLNGYPEQVSAREYVSHDMAIDAGDRSLEGQLCSEEEWRQTAPSLDQVIVGGESGPRFRHTQLEWVRSVRDQCVAAGVPFFFKQWGGPTSKSHGRMLDGRTWDEFPEAR